MSGTWGSTGGGFPGTIWEAHLGTKDAPNQFYYRLDITEAPADPAAKPGELVSLTK